MSSLVSSIGTPKLTGGGNFPPQFVHSKSSNLGICSSQTISRLRQTATVTANYLFVTYSPVPSNPMKTNCVHDAPIGQLPDNDIQVFCVEQACKGRGDAAAEGGVSEAPVVWAERGEKDMT